MCYSKSRSIDTTVQQTRLSSLFKDYSLKKEFTEPKIP